MIVVCCVCDAKLILILKFTWFNCLVYNLPWFFIINYHLVSVLFSVKLTFAFYFNIVVLLYTKMITWDRLAVDVQVESGR